MKKILLCDDEQDIREVIEMLIEMELDAEIQHAENGDEGIQKLESEDFDLIVCDMNMPRVSGDEVFEFNKNNKNIPFLLLSGDASRDILNLDGFLTVNPKNVVINKPWKGEELITKLRLILD